MRLNHPLHPAGPLTLAAALVLTAGAHGYEFDDGDRWSRTATDGAGLGQGDPTTITWSLAPDGTLVPDGTLMPDGNKKRDPSQLIAFFDGLYPGGVGGDLTQRPWFGLFAESFDRWEALSGIDFVYEDDDDASSFSPNTFLRGVLDQRGDIRLGATSVDGQTGANTVAFAYAPEFGEMVIDSDNTTLFSNPANNNRSARNVIMHELGHALGIEHSESSDAAFLMEPFITSSFDGPQLDDILALHRGYGDRYEKANNAAGNETPGHAVPLGQLLDQAALSIGTDAGNTVVDRLDTDFVSIDDNSDIDFFSFQIEARATIDLTLTPQGPSYNTGPQGGTQALFNTAALSDLTLTLFDTDGAGLLIEADNTGLGSAESITGFLLEDPGTYFVRVTGQANAAQLYRLDLLATHVPPLPGDLDGDGQVGQADLLIVLSHFATSVTPGTLHQGDATGDGAVGIEDLDFVLARWTSSVGPALSVPEPATGIGLLAGLFMASRGRRAAV